MEALSNDHWSKPAISRPSARRDWVTSTNRLDPDIFAAARKALDDGPGVPQIVRVAVVEYRRGRPARSSADDGSAGGALHQGAATS
jgi:hypothetical protein